MMSNLNGLKPVPGLAALLFASAVSGCGPQEEAGAPADEAQVGHTARRSRAATRRSPARAGSERPGDELRLRVGAGPGVNRTMWIDSQRYTYTPGFCWNGYCFPATSSYTISGT